MRAYAVAGVENTSRVDERVLACFDAVISAAAVKACRCG